MPKQERRIIGWCAYCKSVLREGDRYTKREHGVSLYHPECLLQKFSFRESVLESEETDLGRNLYPDFDNPEDEETDN